MRQGDQCSVSYELKGIHELEKLFSERLQIFAEAVLRESHV